MSKKADYSKRTLVFDTSALLSVLHNFTDPHTHSIAPLESLLHANGHGDATVDRIIIPDHVFYELTGILPISLPRMRAEMEKAKDNPDKLNELIEFYVMASPRGGWRSAEGLQIKDQLRTVLHFVAQHPDTIQPTEIAKRYCDGLQASFAVFGSMKDSELPNYQPTYGDLQQLLGDSFQADQVRIHAGQLFMLGLLNEEQYNERMERRETALSTKQRFIKSKEFADLLYRDGRISDKQRDEVKKKVDSWSRLAASQAGDAAKSQGAEPAAIEAAKGKAEEDARYLTTGFLRSICDELKLFDNPAMQQGGNRAQGNTLAGLPASADHPVKRERFSLDEALGPTRLLMEHYIFSGVLPQSAIPTIARSLHFEVDSLGENPSREKLKHHLYEQGFYERAITVRDLKTIRAALADAPDIAPAHCAALDKVISHISECQRTWNQRINDECRNPLDSHIMQHQNLKVPSIGCPYEKIISDAVINGSISFAEFWRIVERSGGMPLTDNSHTRCTNRQDVCVKFDPAGDGRNSTIWLRQDGIVNRTGNSTINGYFGQPGVTRMVKGQPVLYWQFNAGDMLARCRQNLHEGRPSNLYRAFESMLYRSVSRNASAFHDIVYEEIGDERLLQIEKDFSNRHYRKWCETMPPFTSMVASQHIAKRIGRKNMGEIAAAEAAATACETYPDSTVWLVNHDSDLFPDKQGVIHLHDYILRQHSHLRDLTLPLTDTLAQLGRDNQLQFMRTDQFLDTLSLVQRRSTDLPYHGLRMKQDIRDFTNTRWARRVHEPLDAAISRQR